MDEVKVSIQGVYGVYLALAVQTFPLVPSTMLTPFKLLSKLEHLEVHGNGITDLDFLVTFEPSALKTFVLSFPAGSTRADYDLTPLSHCKKLESLTIQNLNLDGGHIISLRPLSALAQLHTLSVEGSGAVQDVSLLKPIATLKELNIKGTRVTETLSIKRQGLNIVDDHT